jgi:hypothetical protein
MRRKTDASHQALKPGVGTNAIRSPGRLEFHLSLAIAVRPLAGGLPWRKLVDVPVAIEALDEAVDPTEAQCLANRVLV